MKKYYMSLQERKKQLESAIEDFKTMAGFSEQVIKKYQSQLKEVNKEINDMKRKKE